MNEPSNLKTQDSRLKTHTVLAVIMARGGSVGLPGKSLRPLLGRPVLAYTFDHVRESARITRSVVSSDDPAILNLARQSGFPAIERPAELATATAATDPVLRHAVSTLYLKTQDSSLKTQDSSLKTQDSSLKTPLPAAVVMLYGNVPLRRHHMLDRCIQLLLDTGCDSVQTIAPVGKMHPYWMFDLDPAGRIQKHIPNDIFRRQDLPPLYCPTGAVYVMRTKVLMAAEGSPDPHAFLGTDRRGLVVAPEDSVDIDTERDLWLAEAALRQRNP
jgi:CMP-N,N'-diacetyllegionaminic acid synthase